MIWKKDRLRPTQPYLVFNTIGFRQEIYLKNGISHFYSCHLKENTSLCLVPDGCIDIFFEYGEDSMQGYVIGTRLKCDIESFKDTREIFGVRFMPGIQPELIRSTMRELLEKKIPIEEVLNCDGKWLSDMESEADFSKRIDIFLKAYMQKEREKPAPFGKKEILNSIKQMVYDSDGTIKVHELSEQAGYSERYINRIFIEEMGFSPKIFCKIIQFQRALEFLNYGAPDKMTDAAVFLGYYDQPQFIRDFSRYAGITPKKYLDLVKKYNYRNKVQSGTDFYNL